MEGGHGAPWRARLERRDWNKSRGGGGGGWGGAPRRRNRTGWPREDEFLAPCPPMKKVQEQTVVLCAWRRGARKGGAQGDDGGRRHSPLPAVWATRRPVPRWPLLRWPAAQIRSRGGGRHKEMPPRWWSAEKRAESGGDRLGMEQPNTQLVLAGDVKAGRR
ncbi:hypothetical protein BS78_03G292800 [Paspalum vaginatum]|nr:hypothetical protein BS78_03G292800 [Paspalum vaginatum]